MDLGEMYALRAELRDLRHRNEILNAQMFVVETFARALGLQQSSGAMHSDPLYLLEQEIERREEVLREGPLPSAPKQPE